MNYKIVIYVLNHQIYMSMCTFFLCCLLLWGYGRQTEVLRVALRGGDDNFTIDQQFADKYGNIFEGNTHTSYSKLIYWHVFPISEGSTFQNRGQIYEHFHISLPFADSESRAGLELETEGLHWSRREVAEIEQSRRTQIHPGDSETPCSKLSNRHLLATGTCMLTSHRNLCTHFWWTHFQVTRW